MKYFARILTAVIVAALTVGPVSAATASGVPATTVAQAGPSASTTTGSVTGSVQDESGAPVANADITLNGPATYNASTDASGGFTITSVNPGLYHILAHKPGYSSAHDDITVIAGNPQTLQIRIQKASLTTLTTIASVRSVGRGTFNTTPASVDTVSAQVFQDQGDPQVGQVLNEIPGVQNSLPQSSANAASPGSITFPNIRGGLGFETATLIDGHPLSVGVYGDYVTTFLNSYMLQDAEVIKGPGATADQTNYAINGTVNFRTKDPTLTPTPYYTFGIDNHGGSFMNLGLSDTVLHGRLGFVIDFANMDDVSAINNYQARFLPGDGMFVNNNAGGVLGYQDGAGPLPGVPTQAYNQGNLVACCLPINADLYGNSELVKFRYKLSSATNVTVSYLGSQSTADQNANTGGLYYGEFNPAIAGSGAAGLVYSGPLTPGQGLQFNTLYPITNTETNNEPMFQAEFNTTLGNDTILGRYYHASIDRLGNQGGNDPSVPQFGEFTLNGISVPAVGSDYNVYNNTPAELSTYAYYHQNEIDQLGGYSFRYDHPVADNTYTFAYTGTRTQSVYNTNEAVTLANKLPDGGSYASFGGVEQTGAVVSPGSGQFFQTITGRGTFELSPKMTATAALYENLYQSTYLSKCTGTQAVAAQADGLAAINDPVVAPACYYNLAGSPTNGGVFTTTNTSHFDDRFAFEYRPQNDTAIRYSMGSSIAPPFLGVLSADGSVSCSGGYCTQDVSNPDIKPETAFGYDLGADHRFKDHVTTLSGDLYLTNLYNQFAQDYVQNSNTLCTVAGNGSGCLDTEGNPTDIYDIKNVNINRSKYQGLELRLHRSPQVGLGYAIQGALVRAYVYDLGSSFYCPTGGTLPTCPNQVLVGIVPNVNFTGGSPNYDVNNKGEGGISNQNIPYLQGYGELNYHMRNGAYAALGYTIYGKNNSLNEPPFGVTTGTVRYPINHSLSAQISVYNLFNVYHGLFGIEGQGVAVPLATGQLGATNAGQLGPATYRFSLTKTVGSF